MKTISLKNVSLLKAIIFSLLGDFLFFFLIRFSNSVFYFFRLTSAILGKPSSRTYLYISLNLISVIIVGLLICMIIKLLCRKSKDMFNLTLFIIGITFIGKYALADTYDIINMSFREEIFTFSILNSYYLPQAMCALVGVAFVIISRKLFRPTENENNNINNNENNSDTPLNDAPTDSEPTK